MRISRREMLSRAGMGFGAVAASQLLLGAEPTGKVKSIIYLFMHGGVSHVDTWDPKPELTKWSGKTVPASFVQGLKTSRIDFTKAIVRGSPWEFRHFGQSGIEVSELFPHLGSHVDDMVLIRSCYGDAFDHAPAMYLRGTGSQLPGRPSLGAWCIYGLGSENKNLPSYVVMTDGAMKCGPQGYGSGFLPAVYQGTMLRSGKQPILDLGTPRGLSTEAQKATLNFIETLDKQHLATRQGDDELEARLASYELAFRMQSSAPEATDLSKETEATKKLYGLDNPLTEDFGRKCLLARRLVERDVRFIQLFSGTFLGDDWDNAHSDLTGSHIKMAKKTDQPVAALLTDLKARGLLDSTLVVWSSEFGRTPLAEGKNGRDHHPYAFSMWMAGAGIQGGRVYGSTDEFGLRPVENPVDTHDVNATILRLLGVDHLKLTYFYQGRDMRLTDVHGDREFTDYLLKRG